MESLMLDSSVIRAHACSAGAPHKKGDKLHKPSAIVEADLALIHVSVDALGNPLRLLLTPGQVHEVPYAQALPKDYEAEFVFGDKAYDAASILTMIADMRAEAVIAPKKNRKKQRNYDKEHYKERHLVECFFNKLKHFRRCFSRFDKFARNYLSFLHFASTLIWLRWNVNRT